jgi:hypothetical protein
LQHLLIGEVELKALLTPLLLTIRTARSSFHPQTALTVRSFSIPAICRSILNISKNTSSLSIHR